MLNYKILYVFVALIFANSNIKAQFSQEWESSEISSWNVNGWVSLNSSGEKYLYILEEDKFSIMQSEYSEQSLYSYTFTSAEQLAGYHWNGKNNDGIQAASGSYFYRLTSDNNIITKKMILIK